MPSTPPFDFSPYGIESLWLKTAPAERTLLVVYAHPDDESFGNAGTVARYSAAGVAVHYACGTRGEVGTVEPELLGSYPDIGALRTAELTCAAKTLQMAAVHFLNYRDSGMQGSADNTHPAALAQAPLAQVAGRLVALVRALRPQVVVTFPPYGGYGHPDHVQIHHAALAAFHAAGDATQYPEQLDAGLALWTPQRLYYSTFGTRILKFAVMGMRLFGRDPRHSGRNQDVDFVKAVEEATPVTTRIDTQAYADVKLQAWHCHGSQLEGMGGIERVPAPLRRRMLGVEEFTRVVPPWDETRDREVDLFGDL